MLNKSQKGGTLKYRNQGSEPLKGGDLVLVGDVLGVAATDISVGALGVLVMEGVFNLAKDGGAMTQGQRLYVDAQGLISASPSSNPAGVAWADAGAGEGLALVKINA